MVTIYVFNKIPTVQFIKVLAMRKCNLCFLFQCKCYLGMYLSFVHVIKCLRVPDFYVHTCIFMLLCNRYNLYRAYT